MGAEQMTQMELNEPLIDRESFSDEELARAIDWNLIPTPVKLPLMRLATRQEISSFTQTSFCLNNYLDVTIQDLMDVRNVGPQTLAVVRHFLREGIRECLRQVTVDDESRLHVEFAALRDSPEWFSLTESNVVIYGGDKSCARSLRRHGVQTAKDLAILVGSESPRKRSKAWQAIRQFAVQLDQHLLKFPPTTLYQVTVLRSLLDDTTWIGTIRDTYGLDPQQVFAVAPNLNRQATILKMRRNGATLQEIGDQFLITRERVRQILKQTNMG